jgi:hypothetical protein
MDAVQLDWPDGQPLPEPDPSANETITPIESDATTFFILLLLNITLIHYIAFLIFIVCTLRALPYHRLMGL